MHRTHTAGQVAPAVEALRRAGFEDLSLDLIFGLPAALGRDWDQDLAQAFALEPEHLSLYGLTVEAHTPLGRWTERGEVTPVDEERYAAEFLAADRALAREGYEHYEVSNAARPGRRARHNGAYWRRAPFIGLGPSAHSGFGRRRQWNLREWAAYERAIAEGRSVVAGVEDLSPEAIELEEIYLGLRTTEGLPADRLPPESVAAWTEAGWAVATRRAGPPHRRGMAPARCAGGGYAVAPGHLPARLGAAPADLGAGRHVGILAHPVALVGAAGADLRAGPASVRMHRRAADHEVGTGAADIGAVQQQADVLLLQAG